MSRMKESHPGEVAEDLVVALEELGVERLLDGAYIIDNGDGTGVPLEMATKEQLAAYAFRCDVLRKELDAHLKIVKSNLHQVRVKIGSILTEGDEPELEFVKSIDGTNVKFKLVSEEKVSIIKGHEDDAFLWLFARGMGPIVKETVHAATLKAQMNGYFNRFVAEDADEADDDDNEVPSYVNEDDPEEVAAWEAAKEAREYLNVAAEDCITERIAHLEELRARATQAEFPLDPPEDAFNRYTIITSKLSYRL